MVSGGLDFFEFFSYVFDNFCYVAFEFPEHDAFLVARVDVLVVLEAQQAAFEVLEQGAGVTTTEVYDAVCDVLEGHGFKTLRDGDIEEGFIHSAGHGIGLELHEPPRISDNSEEIEAGTVLTVEPGLYISCVGGVRIEDMVVVTEDGYENYNSMNKDLELG